MSYYSLSILIVYINNSFKSKKKVFFIYKSKYLISILNHLKKIKIIKTFFYKKKTIMCVINLNSKYKFIRLISKSSKKVYFNLKDINEKSNNYILSTNQGINSIKYFRKKKIGGEVILKII
ncbi:30S ribosomal protein S8 [Candidatus Vidania fulgoroideorum]